MVAGPLLPRVGDRQRRGEVGAGAEGEVHARVPQPPFDGPREAVAAEGSGEGDGHAEAGQAYRDIGGGAAGLGAQDLRFARHGDEIDERLAQDQDSGRPAAHGSTTILRPCPALNRSMACGYCSSGSRSLMKTSGSSTPVAKSVGGPLVAVQHRHRAGDGDLLVVDPVRLDGRASSRSRRPRTAGTCRPWRPGRGRPGSPPALPVASMTTSQPRGRSSSSAEAADAGSSRAAGRGQPVRVDVDARRRSRRRCAWPAPASSGPWCRSRRSAHWAPSCAAQHVVAAHRARQRLDQRRVLGVDVLGQPHAVGHRARPRTRPRRRATVTPIAAQRSHRLPRPVRQ